MTYHAFLVILCVLFLHAGYGVDCTVLEWVYLGLFFCLFFWWFSWLVVLVTSLLSWASLGSQLVILYHVVILLGFWREMLKTNVAYVGIIYHIRMLVYLLDCGEGSTTVESQSLPFTCLVTVGGDIVPHFVSCGVTSGTKLSLIDVFTFMEPKFSSC